MYIRTRAVHVHGDGDLGDFKVSLPSLPKWPNVATYRKWEGKRAEAARTNIFVLDTSVATLIMDGE